MKTSFLHTNGKDITLDSLGKRNVFSGSLWLFVKKKLLVHRLFIVLFIKRIISLYVYCMTLSALNTLLVKQIILHNLSIGRYNESFEESFKLRIWQWFGKKIAAKMNKNTLLHLLKNMSSINFSDFSGKSQFFSILDYSKMLLPETV